jgi:hypothetical protein
MFRRKLIRVASALLMILALTLPVAAPAAAVNPAAVLVVTPNMGGTGGGRVVDISAANADFLPGTCTVAQMNGVTTVLFGTVAATGVVVNSDTSITATTPAQAAGTVSITVNQGVPPGAPACTPSATTNTTPTAFTYAAPLINNVGPPSGAAGTTVQIQGINLEGTSQVLFVGPLPGTGTTAATVTGATPTLFSVVVPAGLAPGTFSLSIVNPAGTFPQTASFSVTAPTPTVGPTPFPTAIGGSNLTVTVTTGIQNPSRCGQVVLGPPVPGNPLGNIAPAPAPGSVLPGVTVVVVNANDPNSARSAITDASGVARFPGTTAGTYRITTADNSADYVPLSTNVGTNGNGAEDLFQAAQEGGIGGAGAPAGHLIDTRIVNFPGGAQNIPVALTCKAAGAVAPLSPAIDVPLPIASTGNTAIVFGYLLDWFTGLPIPGATILVNLNVGTDAAPQPGAQLASVLTDANGRFETLEIRQARSS